MVPKNLHREPPSLCEAHRCGDGVVQVGVELCDDGNAADDDGGTSTYVPARCGDGIVHTGFETCDDGNDDDADACSDACVLVTCGDGVLQAGSSATTATPTRATPAAARRCWGLNRYGQLGQGHTETIGDDEAPRIIGPSALGVPALRSSTGGQNACAIGSDRTLRCWAAHGLGSPTNEHIGDNETPASAGPAPVF